MTNNENEEISREELWQQLEKYDEENEQRKKSKSPSNDQFESFRARTSIKIHRDFKPLFDELVAEERENRIDFVDILLEFYAQEKHPEILEAFKKEELKLQKKLKREGKI